MSVQLLDESSVIQYLIDKKVIDNHEGASVQILTGGVSNVVLAISTTAKKLVLKQALAELKVAQLWKADQRRAIIEAKALKLFHSITPEQVPNLVFLDEDRFVLVLERVPIASTVWKSDLLSGTINPEIAAQLGQTLRRWHDYGRSNLNSLSDFAEDELFDQLRIDPFYRFVSAHNHKFSTQINTLIEDLMSNKTSIVHGDFSPKNFMVSPNNKIFVLDFEVTHIGNPVFDLAFVLAHLLCKHVHAPDLIQAKLLKACAENFLTGYEINTLSEKAKSDYQFLGGHTALIALARVEGKSPVNYLDQNQQGIVADLTKSALSSNLKLAPLELFKR
jgi:5-methylthioribose kinase